MTEMCKAVNIPALQDHNSLKAPGCDHTGRCETHSNPFLPDITDSNRYVGALQYMDVKKGKKKTEKERKEKTMSKNAKQPLRLASKKIYP